MKSPIQSVAAILCLGLLFVGGSALADTNPGDDKPDSNQTTMQPIQHDGGRYQEQRMRGGERAMDVKRRHERRVERRLERKERRVHRREERLERREQRMEHRERALRAPKTESTDSQD